MSLQCWIKDSGWKQGVWIKNPILKKETTSKFIAIQEFNSLVQDPKKLQYNHQRTVIPSCPPPSVLCSHERWAPGLRFQRSTWNPNPTVSIPLNLCIIWYQFWMSSCFIKIINFQVHKCWFQSRAALFDHWSWHLVVARKKAEEELHSNQSHCCWNSWSNLLL